MIGAALYLTVGLVLCVVNRHRMEIWSVPIVLLFGPFLAVLMFADWVIDREGRNV